jgi:hypothetical protein
MSSPSAAHRSTASPPRERRIALLAAGRRILAAPSLCYWLALCLAFVALYRELTVPDHLARGYYAWLSSDTLSDAGVYRDLSDGFPFRGIQFPMAANLFPDLLVVLILMKLFGGAAAVADLVYGILQFTALVGVYLAAGKLARVARTDIVAGSVLLVGICLTFFVKSAMPQGAEYVWAMLFQPHCHVGTEVCRIAAVCLLLSLCFHDRTTPRWRLSAGAFTMLCFVTTASDLSFIPQFCLAATVTLLIFWYLDLLRWRQFAAPLVMAWIATIAGWRAGNLVVERAGLYRISIARIGEALQGYLNGELAGLTGGDWAHLCTVVWIAFCSGFILLALRRQVVRGAGPGEMPDDLRRKIFLFTFLAVSGLGSTVATVLMGVDGLTGAHKDYAWALHYQFPLYLGSFFGIGYMAATFLNRLPRAAVRYGGVAAALTCAGAVLAGPSGGASLWTYRPAYVRFLDENAAKYKLSYGITDYWLARSVLLFSHAGLRAYPVTPEIDPYLWCDNRYWYRGYPRSRYPDPQYNFALFDTASYNAARPALLAKFGAPAEELTSGNYHLLVYNRPTDTRFRNLFESSDGLPTSDTPSLYAPGTLIDFRTGGNAGRFKAEGWGIAEAGGSWTLGAKSALLLTLDRPPQSDLLLTVEMHTFAPPERPQFLETVLVNQSEVERWQAIGLPLVQTRQIRIPRRLATSGCLRIDFVNHDPRSPADVGYSVDTRKLGLAVHTIRIDPVPLQ